MALNPLADNPQKPNGTPLSGGLSPRAATGYIEQLLDDEGHTPDHVDATKGEQSNRDEAEGVVPDVSAQELDNEGALDDNSNDDTGNTDEPDGGDIDNSKVDSDDKQAVTDEVDTDSIQTLSELAEALEMPIDDLKSTIKHTLKAAGEEHTVTLADLETGYQIRADYDRSKGQLAEQRKAFEQEQQLRVDSYTQQANALANSFSMMEQMVHADYNSPQMQQLRESDPAEWTARIREGEQKLAQLNHARQQAAANYDQLMTNEQQQFLAREGQKLSQDIEDWGDDKLNSAVDTIKTLGFDDQEVVGIADSRLIKGALELATLRAENKQLKERMEKAGNIVNKVKKTVPKTVKAGKVRGKAALTRSHVGQLKKQLKSSNSVKDAAAVIESLME